MRLRSVSVFSSRSSDCSGAGLIADSPGTLVTLGNLSSPPALLTLFGLAIIGVLLARGVPGALLIGMLVSTVAALAAGMIHFQGVAGLPPSIAPTLFQLDVRAALSGAMLPVILVFFLLALFDSVGTLVGVANQAGLLRDGMLPRARQALLADADRHGRGRGARHVNGDRLHREHHRRRGGRPHGPRQHGDGGSLRAVAVRSIPLVRMIGGGYPVSSTLTLYPIVAPALILVGAFMMAGVREIPWDDLTEAIPAFLTMVMMPLTVSITEGIAFGFIAYAVLKLCTGRHREAHPLVFVFAAVFLARYIWL